jgi:hypothetical protein
MLIKNKITLNENTQGADEIQIPQQPTNLHASTFFPESTVAFPKLSLQHERVNNTDSQCTH